MRTLVASPFKDDAAEMIEFLFGVDARVIFNNAIAYDDQRPGQALMNVLREYYLDGYVELTSSPEDPFYDDSKIPAALDRITRK
jgi:ATP sulfurylase